MTRRQFGKAAVSGAVTLGLSTLANGTGTRAAAEKPNVMVIQPDQHRGTIMSCAGDTQIRTPHMDRLAAGGVRFTQCVSNHPVCSPFRASFQTGLYEKTHGVTKNDLRLSYEHTTFAEVFRDAGYATGYIGKWHLDGGLPQQTPGGYVKPGPPRQGWEEWLGYEKGHEYVEVWRYARDEQQARVQGYDWEPTWHTDMALDFARRKQAEGKPWLYYVAYGPPHRPDQCPQKYLDMFPPEKFVLPERVQDSPRLREAWQTYYAQVTAIDVEVGRIVQGLKNLGALENTIVVYTSDHGDLLGTNGKIRGKNMPHPDAFRIPLIVHWPKRIKARQVCDALVECVDLAPTLLALAGLQVPKQMEGVSMAPWCLGGAGPRKRQVQIMGATWDGERVIEENAKPSTA